MPGMLASRAVQTMIVPPAGSPNEHVDKAVNPWEFERFDGTNLALANAPNAYDPHSGRGSGADYGLNLQGRYGRPGQIDQPIGQVYTRSAWGALTNTLGGQPLPVAWWKDRFNGITGIQTPDYRQPVQRRIGSGGRGPSALGAEQTNALSIITDNPPQPSDLTSIIGGVY